MRRAIRELVSQTRPNAATLAWRRSKARISNWSLSIEVAKRRKARPCWSSPWSAGRVDRGAVSSPGGAGTPGFELIVFRELCTGACRPCAGRGPAGRLAGILARIRTGCSDRARIRAAAAARAHRPAARCCGALRPVLPPARRAAEADRGEPLQQRHAAAFPDAGLRRLRRAVPRISFCAGSGSSSIRGMRGVPDRRTLRLRRDERCAAPAPASRSGRSGAAPTNSDGFGGIGRIVTSSSVGRRHERPSDRAPSRRPRPARIGAAAASDRRRVLAPVVGRALLTGAAAVARVSRAAMRLRSARSLCVTSAIGVRLRGRCTPATLSMPVATTDTRMMPSRLSSKVAPTMMLASWSTSSRMRVAASSTS